MFFLKFLVNTIHEFLDLLRLLRNFLHRVASVLEEFLHACPQAGGGHADFHVLFGLSNDGAQALHIEA